MGQEGTATCQKACLYAWMLTLYTPHGDTSPLNAPGIYKRAVEKKENPSTYTLYLNAWMKASG